MASIYEVSIDINTAIARIDEALAELSSLAVLDNNTNTTQNIKTILQGIKTDLQQVKTDVSSQRNLIEANKDILGI